MPVWVSVVQSIVLREHLLIVQFSFSLFFIGHHLGSKLFLGVMQTVQTLIRRLRMRRLIKVYTVCKQDYLCKIHKKRNHSFS